MTSSTTLDKKAWQSRPLTQLLAVLLVYVPPYAFAIWTQQSHKTITLKELFLFPLLIGGGSVVLVLLVYRFFCGERLSSLNLKPGKWYTDILVGIVLAVCFLCLFVLQNAIQSKWFPHSASPPAQEIITLFKGIVENPLLLALWLGPVAWLGIAAFEELTRIFMLNRLWTVWPKPLGRWLIMIVSAVIFGIAHLYQGPVNAISNGILGLLYAWYYHRFGRIWPMIIGHALYDSLQVIQVVIAFHAG